MSDENTPEVEALRSSRRAQEAATAASDAAKEAKVAVERIVEPTLSDDEKGEAAEPVREEAPGVTTEAVPVEISKVEMGSTYGFSSPYRYVTGSDGIREGGEGEGRV
ncbi:hypothetical protein SAMN05660657_04462 [Geodermatophilus amargosae]|uniref:Uncharacterized protein n=1 Tax=Geodermatophilus amargosae TaxID=1296565 RepID=A0A1I7CGM5_9ACTN|nr:hypothetical protein [Geodermatophilus amargosae]SFT98581.1 hypothetical protein SAMN05660657_04462 [Geodermatophilus amargosae]